MDTAKLYLAYVGMFLKSQMEYKTSFFMGIFANVYCYFITFITFWILINKFTTIGGWNFSEISILYGLNLLTYAISGMLFWYSIYFLEQLVTTGQLDRMLVRPVGIIPQLVCQRFGHTFIGQIIVTLMFLIPALWQQLLIDFSLLKIIYIILAIISGIMIQGGAIIMVGALSFKILRSTDIGQIVYYDIRNFINYPLNIYPGFIKIVLTFILPWAFINYYPSIIILNKAQNSFDLILGLLVPIVALLFFGLSLYLFKKGLNLYASAGN